MNLFLNLKLQAVYTIVLVCHNAECSGPVVPGSMHTGDRRLKQRAFVNLYCVLGLDFNLKDTQIQEDSD